LIREIAPAEKYFGFRLSPDELGTIGDATALEIEFTRTDDVRQFYPVSPLLYRQLLTAKPMYLFFNRLFGFEVTT